VKIGGTEVLVARSIRYPKFYGLDALIRFTEIGARNVGGIGREREAQFARAVVETTGIDSIGGRIGTRRHISIGIGIARHGIGQVGSNFSAQGTAAIGNVGLRQTYIGKTVAALYADLHVLQLKLRRLLIYYLDDLSENNIAIGYAGGIDAILEGMPIHVAIAVKILTYLGLGVLHIDIAAILVVQTPVDGRPGAEDFVVAQSD